jgi:ParB family chromosome partitioning protein
MRNLARFFGIGSEKAPVQQFESKKIESKSENIDKILIDEPKKVNDIEKISIDKIEPNPFQPRKTFVDESLAELSESIREFGVIQPLLLRKTATSYEVVAGERRLRASRMAGLTEVPAIVKSLNDKEMAELAMIENLQREDLHYLEEAEGFASLLDNFGFTQEVLAKRMGKSQSTIANKLRLLKLAPEVRQVLYRENLTERHARALLKLKESERQLEVLGTVLNESLNVRQTELLIEEMNLKQSADNAEKKKKVKIKGIIRDVRIFVNTINHVVGEMKKNGLKVSVEQESDDDYIFINMKIPKRK